MIKRALIALIALTILGATQLVPAAAAPNHDRNPTTSYTYVSNPGDYIGQGLAATYTDPPASFILAHLYGPYADPPTVSTGFEVYVTSGSDWWYINIAPPIGQNLRVGTYTGAERAAFRTGSAPGLDVYGDGRGCNTLSGSFTVSTLLTTKAGTITGVVASFTQYCESSTAALNGTVHFKA
jgi:hypothetical protein